VLHLLLLTLRLHGSRGWSHAACNAALDAARRLPGCCCQLYFASFF